MEDIPKNVKEAIDILLDAGEEAEATAAYVEAMEYEGIIDTFLERVRRKTPPYSIPFLAKVQAEVHKEKYEPLFQKAHARYIETGDAGMCYYCNRGKLRVTEKKTRYGIAYIYDCDTCGNSRYHGVKIDSENNK